jgi:glucose/arabinose dehydrogenase
LAGIGRFFGRDAAMALVNRRGFMRSTETAFAAAGVAATGERAVAAERFVVQTERYRLLVTPRVLGLNHPWGIAFVPGGDLLVTERPGRLSRVSNRKVTRIPGTPNVVAGAQGGLLDVPLDPKFQSNRWVYLTYTGGSPGATHVSIARAKLEGGRLGPLQTLFRGYPSANSTKQFGSRLVVEDDYLFATIGDYGFMDRAQVLSEHAGKIIRLRHNGEVPSSNPFVGKPGALPAIRALGVRNPQGLTRDPFTGRLWEREHGPMGGDEVNIIVRGVDYGWPVITYGRNYDGTKIGDGITAKHGLKQPKHYWTPSIAPSSLSFYNGNLFFAWRGNLFMGTLKYRLLFRMELYGPRCGIRHEERMLEGLIGRIRQICPGPDGRLYVLTDEDEGGIWTIELAA